jgi:hypothetical protein
MYRRLTAELYKLKIALSNLHDGLTRYAEVFGYHVCACERGFVEKVVQAF